MKRGVTLLDLTNQRFGRLVAIEPDGKNKYGRVVWKCKCDCGNYINVNSNSLSQNKTRSCGCLSNERRKSGNIRRTHGGCGTRLYRIWKNMKKRCNNPNSPDYIKWYGSHNIKVCDEWNNSFESFRDWAMSNGYNDNLSIDRIDVDGDYSPNNCRWSTNITQANNKHNVNRIEYNGESHTVTEWANIIGVNRQTLYYRLFVYKWSIERALTTK